MMSMATIRQQRQALQANGEKKILWELLRTALAIFGGVALIATAINAWVVRDYWEFKQTSAKRWEREVENDTRRDEWMKWQSAVLAALAKQHGIAIPEPPRLLDSNAPQ